MFKWCICCKYEYLLIEVLWDGITKGDSHAVTAEPISATAEEGDIFYYGISSLHDGIIIGGYILSVGCVGTRLG